GGGEPATLGVLHRFISNQGTAWQYPLDHLSAYFERVAALSHEQPLVPPPATAGPADGSADGWHELIGGYLESVRTIARRTAELHAALAAVPRPPFTPHPLATPTPP